MLELLSVTFAPVDGRKVLEENRRIIRQRLKVIEGALHYQWNKRKLAADRFQLIGAHKEREISSR